VRHPSTHTLVGHDGSSEAVALVRADQAQHRVTIACLQDLQGCWAIKDCVGRRQEVGRVPGIRGSKAAHGLDQTGDDLTLLELTGGITPVTFRPDSEQDTDTPPLVGTLALDPEPPAASSADRVPSAR
jgi:hypothetical protein